MIQSVERAAAILNALGSGTPRLGVTEIADRVGLAPALYLASAGAMLGLLATRHWRLHSGPEADLTPSMHWPQPVLAAGVEEDAGPVLVTVEYKVPSEHRAAFLSALARIARERRRDGAFSWAVFQDTAHPDRILETFLLDSWLEHLRQHQRVTQADRRIQESVLGLLREAPHVTHYVPPSLQGGGRHD